MQTKYELGPKTFPGGEGCGGKGGGVREGGQLSSSFLFPLELNFAVFYFGAFRIVSQHSKTDKKTRKDHVKIATTTKKKSRRKVDVIYVHFLTAAASSNVNWRD